MQSVTVNIGLDRNDKQGRNTPAQVELILGANSLDVHGFRMVQSGTEPTFVGRLEVADGIDVRARLAIVARDLHQDCIGARIDGIGDLVMCRMDNVPVPEVCECGHLVHAAGRCLGCIKADWNGGAFNADFFTEYEEEPAPAPYDTKEIDSAVLGVVRAEGPIGIGRLSAELAQQTTGPWDQAADIHGIRYLTTLAAVASLNRLTRAGLVELYDTGDAWDAAEPAPAPVREALKAWRDSVPTRTQGEHGGSPRGTVLNPAGMEV